MAYTYQAPKDLAAQSAKYKADNPSAAALVNAGSHLVMLKYDGVFSASYTASETSLTREGNLQLSAGNLAKEARKIFGNNKLVFMELWVPNAVHKTINGMARREYLQPDLRGVVFDVIDTDTFQKGKGGAPYEDRYGKIKDLLTLSQGLLLPAQVLKLDPLKDDLHLQELAGVYAGSEMDAVATGKTVFGAYDGLILRDKSAPWKAGASKNGEVLRVKAGMSLDLKIIAQHAEVRPTKLGGFLTVEYKGVPTDVGSGLTQEMLEAIMVHKASAPRGINYVNLIAEVYCLGITPAGKLREPRLKGIRHDTQREEDK